MKEEKLDIMGIIFAIWRYKGACFCCGEQETGAQMCELRIYDRQCSVCVNVWFKTIHLGQDL
jgi:hypothetical protein